VKTTVLFRTFHLTWIGEFPVKLKMYEITTVSLYCYNSSALIPILQLYRS